MNDPALAHFLRGLPRLLGRAREARKPGKGSRPSVAPTSSLRRHSSLSEREARRLLAVLDCDRDGLSLRSGKPAWPESWDQAHHLAQCLGADVWMVHVLASWLEGVATTSRKTYCSFIRDALTALCIHCVSELRRLPGQAALTWQRDQARRLMPRTVNGCSAALNSLMHHVVKLGLAPSWASLPALKITRGRHVDRVAVVLDEEQLLAVWKAAESGTRRQFLAIMLASLHGLRAAEIANLRWRDVRWTRRGKHAAPAVLSIVGKGKKHRLVQVHPAIRRWLEKQRIGNAAANFLLADTTGAPPTAATVGRWAKDVFRRANVVGYGHSLRATWATMALEHGGNDSLTVQLSGGWKDPKTMLGHYFRRRNVKPVRLIRGHGNY